MNASDARIVRLFTTQVDGLVEDDAPNANSPVPDQFDLLLQAEAGALLGNSGANYTLTFTAVNDDTLAHQPPWTRRATPSRRSGTSPAAGCGAAMTSSRPAPARPAA